MKDTRVTFKRRHAYSTKSNVLKVVKTPGGRLVGAYKSKNRAGPKCGDCKNSLPGVKRGAGVPEYSTSVGRRPSPSIRLTRGTGPSAATRLVRGDESRRRRGRDVDRPSR